MLETLKNLRVVCVVLGTGALVVDLVFLDGDNTAVIVVLTLIAMLVLTNSVIKASSQNQVGKEYIDVNLTLSNAFCDKGEEDGITWQVRKTSDVCFTITVGKRTDHVYVKREPIFGLPARELDKIKLILTNAVNIVKGEQKYAEDMEF
ncbi:hypothetical protein [Paenibacillus gallinarum]|uniref:YcxB-like protein domain-containing protein n=1 Tax=Paenibacillus gallinarum TaxID=2762232 RepID=A0ABR8T4N7_9BACL|nr:hypothetical protein [Paenibacillus gallinarum]MBD7970259.1 hypothetical protein [Paenibacillus gallinarum]